MMMSTLILYQHGRGWQVRRCAGVGADQPGQPDAGRGEGSLGGIRMGPDVARRLRHHVPLLHQRTHPPAAACAAAAPGEAWFEADLRGRRAADVQAAYRRDGVVCLRRAFDASWIETLREIVPAALAPDNADLEQYSDGFAGEMDCARKYPTVQDFVFSSPCAELAARVIGSASLNFFYDFLFVKEPGAAARTPWHQASPPLLPWHQASPPLLPWHQASPPLLPGRWALR